MEQWIADVVGTMHVYKVTQTALAKHMGWRRDYISRILSGSVAPKLAKEKITQAVKEMIIQKGGML